VHTPRSTLASIAGQAGAALEPLFEVHKRFILGCRVLHADETPVALLDPGAGKTRRAYIWAYARSLHDAVPGVVYDFCLGRGAQYPVAFLGGDEQRGHRRWSGTLLTDRYSAYDTVLDPRIHPDRIDAACAAHARASTRNWRGMARAHWLRMRCGASPASTRSKANSRV
jgi:transposase